MTPLDNFVTNSEATTFRPYVEPSAFVRRSGFALGGFVTHYFVWGVEATLLKSTIRGVKRANPNARIILWQMVKLAFSVALPVSTLATTVPSAPTLIVATEKAPIAVVPGVLMIPSQTIKANFNFLDHLDLSRVVAAMPGIFRHGLIEIGHNHCDRLTAALLRLHSASPTI